MLKRGASAPHATGNLLPTACPLPNESHMSNLRQCWRSEQGQNIAEYAVMLAVILVLVVGTIRLVGSNANNAFSSVASSLQ